MPSFYFSSDVLLKEGEKTKTPQSLSRPWQRETGWGKETRSVSEFGKRISRTGLGERNVSLKRFEEP
ncbi:hypothetical protein TNCV_2496521 [Trichonephila clavipes]|nr:hypothetical protein TNCV_2496521 [Trichonephila clavipes]